MRKPGIRLLCLGALLVPCGCSQIAAPTPTLPPIAKPTRIPATVAATVAASAPSLEPTIEVLPSPQPTSTFVPYPIETLKPEAILELESITEQPEGCRLPCWNHLTPGVSSPSEIGGFFARLGLNVYADSPYVSDAGSFLAGEVAKIAENQRLLRISVQWSDSVVQSIWLEFIPLGYDLRPVNLIANLGTPGAVSFDIRGTDGPPPYDLMLDFPQVGLVIHVSGWAVQPWTRVCFTDEEDPIAYVWLYDSVKIRGMDLVLDPYGPQDGGTQLSQDEIITLLSNAPGCIPFGL